MHNKSGFSLLELMIALLISSMIIAGLFTTISQITRVQQSITTVTDINQKAAIVFAQLERDIMGVFVPEEISPIKPDGKDAKMPPVLDKIFYGTSRENNFELLTFITNNPLEMYMGIKNSKPRARTARIVYRLEPQKGVKDSFEFMRQEGNQLSFDRYKKQADKKNAPQLFTLADDVASLQVFYLTPEKKQEDDAQKVAYKKEKKWEADAKNKHKLPEMIEIQLVLWDMVHENKIEFNYMIPIMYTPSTIKRCTKPAPPVAKKEAPLPKINVSKGKEIKKPDQKIKITHVDGKTIITGEA